MEKSPFFGFPVDVAYKIVNQGMIAIWYTHRAKCGSRAITISKHFIGKHFNKFI